MKMKNVLRTTLIVFLTGTAVLSAGMRYHEYMFIPWGERENTVKHAAYQGLHTGPLAFQVRGTEVLILDSENGKLKTFDESGLTAAREINVPGVVDFYLRDGGLYLSGLQRVVCDRDGGLETLAEEKDVKKMFQGFYEHEGLLGVRHSDGVRSLAAGSMRKAASAGVPQVRRELPDQLIFSSGTREVRIHVPGIGSVEYLGDTPEGYHYCYAESIVRHVPLATERFVYLLDGDGNVLSRITLPRQKYTYSFREFDVDAQGDLYHMHAAKDGIHIIRWAYDPGIAASEARYPDTFSEVYHFNGFAERAPASAAPALSKTSNSPVTRSEALETGDAYVQHVWTATSSNIGTTSTVTTPSWVQVGENQRIPYKWGGWSTVAQFDAGIAAGKLAGDINTSTVDWGNSVGADCSGFVSVCWNTSQKYGTSTFHNCSSELSNFNELLPADATNNAGSHIRMVVEWTGDGKLVQIEETSSGDPGWAARYYTWRLSDITNYVPIRYDLIQESLAPRPALLSAVTVPDSVELRWEADESVDFSGYRVYGRDVGGAFTLDTVLSKGIHSVKRAADPDVHREYRIAAYTEGGGETASDVYAVKAKASGREILIVDGFDRFGGSGSWSSPVHDLAARSGEALDIRDIAYESCANEAVIRGEVDLKDYALVWWILGDESTVDETFNAAEQDSVESYLRQGGKIFVSGSEIAWDLDNKGSTADKTFIHDYLKATYAADDAGNYSVSGAAGTVFEGLSLQYSDDGSGDAAFAEDYPDVFATTGGSSIALKYGNSQTAAVAFDGTAPGGSAACRVMVMGFPFETVATAFSKEELAGYVLRYMGYEVELDVADVLPVAYELYPNYPNPFNPATTIAYRLDAPARVELDVYDIRGTHIRRLQEGARNAGRHEVLFHGTNLPSGVYVYRLRLNGETAGIRKMTLVK